MFEFVVKVSFIFAIFAVAPCLIAIEHVFVARQRAGTFPKWNGVRGLFFGYRDGLTMIIGGHRLRATDRRRRFGTVTDELAGILFLSLCTIAFAVIPFGQSWSRNSESAVALTVVPGIDFGLLLLFAMHCLAACFVTSRSTKSADDNKRWLTNQLALGLSLAAVVLVTGTMSLEETVRGQAATGIWLVAAQPLAFVIFLVAAFDGAIQFSRTFGHIQDQTIRSPALILNCQLYWLCLSLVVATVFLGGWHFWWIVPVDVSQTSSNWTTLFSVLILTMKAATVFVVMTLLRLNWPVISMATWVVSFWRFVIAGATVNLIACALAAVLATELVTSMTVSWICFAVFASVVAVVARRDEETDLPVIR